MCSRHSCIQKLILIIFVFLAFNIVLNKSNETGILCSQVFAQSCSPALLGSYDADINISGIHVSGNTAYVVTNSLAKLIILNVTNPAGPVLLGSFPLTYKTYSIFVSGDTAYVCTDHFLEIIDVSNPLAPSQLGYFGLPFSGSVYDVYVSGNIAYVASSNQGLLIVDVSNPALPSLLGSHNTPLSQSGRGVFVADNKAYLTHSGPSGLLIIDVSNPAATSELGSYVTPGYANDVYVSGTTAYVSANTPSGSSYPYPDCGLYIIDVSNPVVPSLTAFQLTPGNAGDFDVSNGSAYVSVDGKYTNERGIGIIDVSNPTSPSALDFYPASTDAVSVSGNKAYFDDGDFIRILDIEGCEGGDFPVGRPLCDMQLNGTTFVDGDTVTADVFRIANVGTAAIPVEFAIWMEAPGLFPIRILKIGSLEEGTIQSMNLPPGHEQDDGPIDLFMIDSTFPRGDYVIGLRMVDPVTQKLQTFDLNDFTILP